MSVNCTTEGTKVYGKYAIVNLDLLARTTSGGIERSGQKELTGIIQRKICSQALASKATPRQCYLPLQSRHEAARRLTNPYTRLRCRRLSSYEQRDEKDCKLTGLKPTLHLGAPAKGVRLSCLLCDGTDLCS